MLLKTFAIALLLLIGACAHTKYNRLEYLSGANGYQFVSVTAGASVDLGSGFGVEVGGGEYMELDTSSPAEIITIGGSYDYGRLSISVAGDVVDPWASAEFSLYTSIQLTY